MGTEALSPILPVSGSMMIMIAPECVFTQCNPLNPRQGLAECSFLSTESLHSFLSSGECMSRSLLA